VNIICSLIQAKTRQVGRFWKGQSAASISRTRTCREILDRLGQNHAAGPTFKRLQFREAADPGRDARELHGLAAIRAARRVCGCVHGFGFLFIEPITVSCRRLERQLPVDAINAQEL
jgi:hypothetical protein